MMWQPISPVHRGKIRGSARQRRGPGHGGSTVSIPCSHTSPYRHYTTYLPLQSTSQGAGEAGRLCVCALFRCHNALLTGLENMSLSYRSRGRQLESPIGFSKLDDRTRVV